MNHKHSIYYKYDAKTCVRLHYGIMRLNALIMIGILLFPVILGIDLVVLFALLMFFCYFFILRRIPAALLQDVLYRDCDAVKMKNIIFITENKVKAERAKVVWRMLRVQALSYIRGREQDSFELLQTCKEYKMNKEDEMFYLSLHMNHYAVMQQWEDYQKVKEKMKNLLSTQKFSKKNKLMWERYMKGSQAKEKFYAGEFEEARNLYQELLDDGKYNMLNQVIIHRMLAAMDIKEDKSENAKQHLDFVVQNGGTTHMADEAKEKLQIPVPEPEEEPMEITEDSGRTKKTGEIDIVDRLCVVLFAFAYVLLIMFGVLIEQTNVSIKMMRFLLAFGVLLGGAFVCGILRLFRIIKEKKHKKAAHLAVVIISAILMVLAFSRVFNSIPEINPYWGNNANASTCTNMPSGFGKRDLESAIEKAVIKEKLRKNIYNEIFRVENEDRVWVYFQGKNQVRCYEFRLEDGRYYCVGSSSAVYYDFFEHNYSDIDTMRSDISFSLRWNSYTIDAKPIWGVTENENVSLIKINSVGIDFVKEISDTDGGKYYFWLIEDGSFLKQEDIENLVIEGIE